MFLLKTNRQRRKIFHVLTKTHSLRGADYKKIKLSECSDFYSTSDKQTDTHNTFHVIFPYCTEVDA